MRILIVDDHAILRDGIRSLLERQEGLEVIGEAANGCAALAQVAELAPDLVLMDVAMPEMDGLEATRQIKVRFPQVKVLILTQHDDQEYIGPLLQAGASGYVLKRSGGHELVNAIHQVMEQGGYLEPSVARQVIAGYAGHEVSRGESGPVLTEREEEVLRLVLAGKSNKEIAKLLCISPKTVSVHRSNMMTKLEVHNSVELIHYVTKHHLIER